MTKEDYNNMTLVKLKEIAKEAGVKNISKFKKDELIEEILKLKKEEVSIEKNGVILKEKISPKQRDERATVTHNNYQNSGYQNNNYQNNNYQNNNYQRTQETNLNTAQTVQGILEIQENNSFGFLRGDNYLSSSADIYVSPAQIRRFNLATGDKIQGKVREAKEGEKFKALIYVEKVNDEAPEKAIRRKSFD